jgi:hypothetical protein
MLNQKNDDIFDERDCYPGFIFGDIMKQLANANNALKLLS